MVAKWKGTVAAAIAWAGLAWGQQPASAPSTLECPRVITVQELGKKAKRCRVLKTWREADGMVAFEVQAISTGERMTVVESGAISDRAGTTPGSHMQVMTTRIYHWAGGMTPPPGAPLPPANAVVRTKPAAPAASPNTSYSTGQYQNWPTPVASPYPAVAPQPAQTASAAGKEAARPATPVSRQKPSTETAAPTDWHLSWGRAEDHRASLPKAGLPQADSSKPDPLQDPETYSRRPVTPAQTTAAVKPGQPAAAPASAVPPPAVAASGGEATMRFGVLRTADGERLYDAHQDPVQIVKESPTIVALFQRLLMNAPRTEADRATVAQPVVTQSPLKPKADQIVVVQPKQAKETVAKATQSKSQPVTAKAVKAKADKSKAAKEQVVVVSPASQGGMPLPVVVQEDPITPGTGSVVAAGFEPGEIMYMPVPFISLPPLTNPHLLAGQQPAPPPAPMPQLPPKGDVENAFTTAEPPPAAAPQMPPEAMNAFITPADGGQQAPGYPPNAAGMYMVSPTGRPFPGYSQGVNPYMMVPNPYAAAGAGGFPYRFPTRAPAPTVVARADVRGHYDGRTNTLIERGAAPVKQVGGPAVDVPMVLAQLRTSLYPSHREWAANSLAAVDWHKQPEALDALVQAAREDPAATVRAACVHSLGKINANTKAVQDALQALKADASPLVVQEVDLTLARFNTTASGKK